MVGNGTKRAHRVESGDGILCIGGRGESRHRGGDYLVESDGALAEIVIYQLKLLAVDVDGVSAVFSLGVYGSLGRPSRAKTLTNSV